MILREYLVDEREQYPVKKVILTRCNFETQAKAGNRGIRANVSVGYGAAAPQ
jgi:hypothetical protein